MRSLEVLQGIDHRLFYWCAHSRHKQSLSIIARLVSKSADGYLHILLPLMIYSSNSANGAQLFKTLCYALVFERILYWILKNSCRRLLRPKNYPVLRV